MPDAYDDLDQLMQAAELVTPKTPLESKTVLFNSTAVAIFGALAAYWPDIAPLLQPLVPAQAFGILGAVFGIGNIILRAMTRRPLSLTSADPR